MKENTRLVEPNKPTVIPMVTGNSPIISRWSGMTSDKRNQINTPCTILSPVVNQLITDDDGL